MEAFDSNMLIPKLQSPLSDNDSHHYAGEEEAELGDGCTRLGRYGDPLAL